MKPTLVILKSLLALAACGAIIGWWLWRSLKRSDDPAGLLFKWAISAALGVVMIGFGLSVGWSPALPIIGAVFGLAFGIIWAPHLGALIASPFTSMFDGGDLEPEQRPFYAIAEAKRKRGLYDEALAEIDRQLEKFPTDFQGWLLRAEIQAENQQNIPAALETIEQLIAQPGHAPKNVAFALHRCADWELKRGDPAAACRAFERIAERFPDTEEAQTARQRLARFTSPDATPGRHEAHAIPLKQGDNRLGLRVESAPEPAEPAPAPAEDLAAAASQLVKRLEQFPDDHDARERLAVIYAEHYQRRDLAEEQLEQLAATPNVPPKQIVHWLNLKADLQIKIFADLDAARATLHRITELFPKSAFAENALNRIAYLKLEARGQQKSQVLKLGSYEKNLGLK